MKSWSIFLRQIAWIGISFLALGLPIGVSENLNRTSLAFTICGYLLYASVYIFYIKSLVFTLDDLNSSLVNIKEAIEDLPGQDSPHVKNLRRMFERTPHISGCGLFGVERLKFITISHYQLITIHTISGQHWPVWYQHPSLTSLYLFNSNKVLCRPK